MVVRLKTKKTVQRADGSTKEREVTEPTVLHCDVIRDSFWREHPELLA